MSYCRFGEDGSDVYVYPSTSCIVCCGCSLDGAYEADTPREMLNHLTLHIVKGHKVPRDAIDRLEQEIQTEPDKSSTEKFLETKGP